MIVLSEVSDCYMIAALDRLTFLFLFENYLLEEIS